MRSSIAAQSCASVPPDPAWMSMKHDAGSIGLLNIRRNSMSPTRFSIAATSVRDRLERRVVVVGAREREQLRAVLEVGVERGQRRGRRPRAPSFPCRAPARAWGRPRSSGLRARARPRRAAPPSHRSQRYLRRSAVRARRSSSGAAIWFRCSASMAMQSFAANENYSRSEPKPLPAKGFPRRPGRPAFDLSLQAAGRRGIAASRTRERLPCIRPKASPRTTSCRPRCRRTRSRSLSATTGSSSAAPSTRRSSRRSRRSQAARRSRRRRALSRRPRRRRVRRRPARRRRAGARGLALCRAALALLQAAGAAARDRRARIPGRRMGPHASLSAAAAERRRATSPASARRSARRAATSPIRACRRR